MQTDHRTKAKIVDLLRYKQAQAQRRLGFTGPASPRPVLAFVRPFRTLTPREVAHRQRMAAFLGASQR